MTIDRRWIAREWLYLLFGLLGGLAVAFVTIFLFGPIFHTTAGRVIVVVLSYVLVRITIWAIRTLREQK